MPTSDRAHHPAAIYAGAARFSGVKWCGFLELLRGLHLEALRRHLELSTPILLLSLFSGLSGKPIFTQNRSIPQQRLFFEAHRDMPFFVRAGINSIRLFIVDESSCSTEKATT